MPVQRRNSFYDATARLRIERLLDPASFREFLPPTQRRTSPHLVHFDVPVSYDDGVVIGQGLLGGKPVLVFAQEGRFMGGALGEIHASKIVGLIRRARRDRLPVLGLLDSGGVRLQEANVGEIGASEIARAALAARADGIRLVGLIGGVCGCFGGMGIITCCFDALVASERARLGVSGPEVIETNIGVQEFDSRDKALVWRTTGAKNRFLFGIIARLVEDHIPDFRAAALDLLAQPPAPLPTDPKVLQARVAVLADRLARFGALRDAVDVWRTMGLPQPERIPDLEVEQLARLVPAPGARA